ncbi:MAG: leucine-rich repeat domain-containing protein [Candidatus Helarchaeota archaeon]
MEYYLHQWGITPEVEFWAHCSNLQVWYEHNYDTRLLHSNLSFPLLKALSEAGDKLAKRAYKEEIAKRFIAGPYLLRDMLKDEGYLDIFTKEEVDVLYREFLGDEYDALLEIFSIIGKRLQHSNSCRINCFGLGSDEDVVTKLSLTYCELPEFPEAIRRLKHLKELRIESCGLRELPEWICELKELRVLDLSRNCLERLPESISELNNLYRLDLKNNRITHIFSLKNGLKELASLNLGGNPVQAADIIELLRTREWPRKIFGANGIYERLSDDRIKISRLDSESKDWVINFID